MESLPTAVGTTRFGSETLRSDALATHGHSSAPLYPELFARC